MPWSPSTRSGWRAPRRWFASFAMANLVLRPCFEAGGGAHDFTDDDDDRVSRTNVYALETFERIEYKIIGRTTTTTACHGRMCMHLQTLERIEYKKKTSARGRETRLSAIKKETDAARPVPRWRSPSRRCRGRDEEPKARQRDVTHCPGSAHQ
eukprot:Amastigsp_a509617_36.p3 type:complete len:153 gc:universal Amastigsp_a509617_36:1152-694(-)